MTKKDLLLRAAEILHRNGTGYSCYAIRDSYEHPAQISECEELVSEYGKFYEKDIYVPWWHPSSISYDKSNQERIMAVLWFREVGMEGIT